jgi:hypothetical protein
MSEYSRGMGAVSGARPATGAVRAGLIGAAVAGALCLTAATFATVIEIRVGATTRLAGQDTLLSGWDRHGPALLLLGAFALVLVVVALRGSRAAWLALAVVGLVAVLIALLGDVPDLHATGFIGEVYDDAAAGPGIGFYLETLGGVLLLVAGGLMFALGGPERRAAREGERPAPAR